MRKRVLRLFSILAACTCWCLLGSSLLLWATSYWRAVEVAWIRPSPAEPQLCVHSDFVYSTRGRVVIIISRTGCEVLFWNEGWHLHFPPNYAFLLHGNYAGLQDCCEGVGVSTSVTTNAWLLGGGVRIKRVLTGPRSKAERDAANVLIVVPYWFVAVIFGLPCVPWSLRIRRRLRARRRRAAGRCPRCGYDLTGNTSGVCPECGAPVTAGADQVSGRRCGPPENHPGTSSFPPLDVEKHK
jgi:hypothetical protein